MKGQRMRSIHDDLLPAFISTTLPWSQFSIEWMQLNKNNLILFYLIMHPISMTIFIFSFHLVPLFIANSSLSRLKPSVCVFNMLIEKREWAWMDERASCGVTLGSLRSFGECWWNGCPYSIGKALIGVSES